MGDTVESFWQKFCETKGIDVETPYQSWYFGNSAKMAIELANLVVFGDKTATASLATINKLKPEEAPILDGYSVVTDFEKNPICVIQTTEIRHLPFNCVDPKFAYDEGEGNRTLEYWQVSHWRYFTKEAAENDLEFNENSLICCERFKLLYSK